MGKSKMFKVENFTQSCEVTVHILLRYHVVSSCEVSFGHFVTISSQTKGVNSSTCRADTRPFLLLSLLWICTLRFRQDTTTAFYIKMRHATRIRLWVSQGKVASRCKVFPTSGLNQLSICALHSAEYNPESVPGAVPKRLKLPNFSCKSV